ncbi:aldehyde dehydrogenase family protein [Agrococcus sp. ARC_14]|uniref:aldehyde dehydrogenase family protein n=1 Tax=Agrococcus sp. ARC_14 TaxID=2919927 RepID=UPI001F06847D|nr:aldehyde dehydrogenase family protein [Agrococcus sp. ARC_14]MCH1881801.1 aldehyde dehydrogenase family protein [Agrococcus sp. ARC_14]
MAYRSIDPSTGELIAEHADATDAEIETVLQAAADASAALPSLEQRIAAMRAIAQAFRDREAELAETIAREMGKPLPEGVGEVRLSAAIWEWYADRPELLGSRDIETTWRGREARVELRPIGPLIGVMPWNFPYYQVARLAAPNLLLGNPVIIKHAGSCTGAALAMQEIADAAGLQAGVYQTVLATNEQIAGMIEDPRVQGVSLTGSERAGAAVAEVAGRALKRCVLELGGSDPFIVLGTDDLDTLVATAIAARTRNAGQACTAAKRFIVHESLHDAFVEKLVVGMAALRIGSPLEEGVEMGPLSSEAAAAQLVGQVESAVAEGATLVAGGRRIDRPGAFVEPGVLTGVDRRMRVWHEELFGPVAIVVPVRDAAEAVEVANDSPFGLGANVFDTDEAQAEWVAQRLEVGMVSIGAFGVSRPELPFGGVKRSGFGRELGPDAVLEFANRRLVTQPTS